MLIHAHSLFGVPLGIPGFGVPIGVAPGTGVPLGIPGLGVPIGVAPGQGLWDPLALGTPQSFLVPWDPGP